jgi:glycogen(starch) synthase
MTADAMGGVWTYALDLSESLGDRNIEVLLAVMGALPSPDQRRQALRLRKLQIVEAPLKLEWMDDPWNDVARAGDWLLETEERFQPDVVHLNGYCHGALPWQAPTVMVAHSCVLSWWLSVNATPAPPAWDRYRREVTRGIHGADLLVAPSLAMLSSIERFYGCPERAMVIPNGRRSGIFTPAKKEPYVLSAGRIWDQAKNIAALDRIASRLPWPVHIAGDNKHPDGHPAECASLRMLGVLNPQSLAGWMGRASIFALPARYEPFGLSILEAALSGCALVLGDIPSLRENWDGAARFVSPGDGAALEAAIQGLIKDRNARQSLSLRARERALGFTAERMAAGYRGAYMQVLGNRFERSPDPLAPAQIAGDQAAPCAL